MGSGLNDLSISDESDSEDATNQAAKKSKEARLKQIQEERKQLSSKMSKQRNASDIQKSSLTQQSKASQRRKDIDDLNKSIDSIDNIKLADSTQETSKVPVLISLRQIQNQEPKILLWNANSGEIIKEVDSNHSAPITGIQRTPDFKIVTVSKDSKINLFF